VQDGIKIKEHKYKETYLCSSQYDGGYLTSVTPILQAFTSFSLKGDKTFLIAAILAMHHPALPYLWVPSVRRRVYLLCSYGPSPSPHLMLMDSSVLFIAFGTKVLMEARAMKCGSEKIQED